MLSRSYLTKYFPLKRLVSGVSPVTGTCNKLRLLSTPANTTGFPTPILFDYETIKNNLTVADAVSSVEEAFGALANGKVDVPMPMHIGIEESKAAGPGDCHIKVCWMMQVCESLRIYVLFRHGTYKLHHLGYSYIISFLL